jgi:AraC family transcriptional regulator, regulatory protein of adaptative response / methylated-DNA-[protein]-cysteine methyltransferase
MARDSRVDGTFVFGVHSTGIYCRPSCPARRPRPEHVVFFQRPDEAERAGFRACRRCHPRLDPASDPRVTLIESACRYIEEHLDVPLNLAALAQAVGSDTQAARNPHSLQRLFTRLVGITPRQYVDACRLDHVKARLRAQEAITHAVYDAGYGSSSRLYERAAVRLGMTPGAYRRGGKEMHIEYSIVNSPLGRLLVAATERGVCAVSLGDSDGPLEAALRAEYPAADLHKDGATLRPWAEALVSYLRGQTPSLALPLDIQATAFQRKVWDALRAIPYGATRSYGEIARALGRPSAVRAVARACATNPVSLVIPCHRVVREDGALGGYRWGMERKRALLAQERRAASHRATPALGRTPARRVV